MAQVSKERGDNAVARLMRRLDEVAADVAKGIENEWNVTDEEAPAPDDDEGKEHRP